MATLANFPLVSQLTDITSDGLPSNNAQLDCVAASIGAAILWYEGKTAWDETLNPDKLKDFAYGETYKGGTAATAYVAFCASLGYHLYAINGTPGALVTDVHQQIQAGHPVIFTEPDPYVSASLGWSHVCVFYAEDSGTLTALDPYIAKPVKRTDNEWTQLLLFNQIWILERNEDVPKILDITDPTIARYFELASSDGLNWRCRATGKIVQGGMLEDYRTNGLPLCGLSIKRLPMSNEIPIELLPVVGAKYAHLAGKGIVVQFYEAGAYVYDPHHLVDNPPGAGAVYPLKLYDQSNPAGQGPIVTALQQQIAPLQSQIAQLEAQIAQAGNPQAIAALQARISKAIADLS